MIRVFSGNWPEKTCLHSRVICHCISYHFVMSVQVWMLTYHNWCEIHTGLIQTFGFIYILAFWARDEAIWRSFFWWSSWRPGAMFQKSVPQRPPTGSWNLHYVSKNTCKTSALYEVALIQFEDVWSYICSSMSIFNKYTNIKKTWWFVRGMVSIIFIFTPPSHPCQARQLQLWFLTLTQGLGVRVCVYHPKNPKQHAAGLSLRCRVRPRFFYENLFNHAMFFYWRGSRAIPVKKPFTNGSSLTFAFVSHFAATILFFNPKG